MGYLHANASAGDCLDSRYDLGHLVSFTRAEIKCPILVPVFSILEGEHVRSGEIGNMHVVPHGSSVRCGIIRSEDAQWCGGTLSGLDRQRY